MYKILQDCAKMFWIVFANCEIIWLPRSCWTQLAKFLRKHIGLYVAWLLMGTAQTPLCEKLSKDLLWVWGQIRCEMSHSSSDWCTATSHLTVSRECHCVWLHAREGKFGHFVAHVSCLTSHVVWMSCFDCLETWFGTIDVEFILDSEFHLIPE
jgi:hypothetical protein